MKISNYIKENCAWIFPLIAGLVLIFLWLFTKNDFGVLVQIIIFVAIIWYSFETRELKLSGKLSNELEQKPIIDFFYRPITGEHKTYLRLRNSGKGVAYNIGVETIIENNETFEFFFKDPNLILAMGDEQTLEVNASYIDESGGKIWPSDPLSRFLNYVNWKTWKNKDSYRADLLIDDQKVKVIVTYENAIKKRYKRIFYIYKQIVKTGGRKGYEVEFRKEEIL